MKPVYVNFEKLIDSPAFFKEAWTDRGDGKTSLIAKTAFYSWLESGKTAVLCRRTWTCMGPDWRADILGKVLRFAPESREMGLKWGGGKKTGLHLSTEDGRTVFLAFPFTMADAFKSAMDVSTHKNLYLDEYCPLNGQYLRNETELILEIYRTIDRKTYSNYVLVCGNRLIIKNPPATDLFFNIEVNYNKNSLKTYKDGTLAILVHSNRANAQAESLSPLGTLTRGTAYGEYVAGGAFEGRTIPVYGGRLKKPLVSLTDGFVRALVWLVPTGGICLSDVKLDALTDVPQYTVSPRNTSGIEWCLQSKRLMDFFKRCLLNGAVYFRTKKDAGRLQNIYDKLFPAPKR